MSQCLIHWYSKERYQNDKQATYTSFPKFLEQIVDQSQHSLKVFKTYFLISVFAHVEYGSIQHGGSLSTVVSTPPDGGYGQFDPICPNGVASTTKVSIANTEKCISCNNGFGLDGDLSRQFNFTCDGSVSLTGKVPKKNIEKCASCDSYYALKSDKTCAEIIVSTFASTGMNGFMEGASNGAQFDSPTGVAVDSSGFIYVADQG